MSCDKDLTNKIAMRGDGFSLDEKNLEKKIALIDRPKC